MLAFRGAVGHRAAMRIPSSRLALFFVALTPAFAAAACSSNETVAVAPMTTSTTAPPPATATASAPKEWKSGGVGIDEASMDTSIDACSDFYEFACGSWIKNTQIPEDQSKWYRSSVLAEKNETKLKEFLEADAASPGGAYGKQLGDYYASCMDETAIEKAGTAPLHPYLAEVAKVHDSGLVHQSRRLVPRPPHPHVLRPRLRAGLEGRDAGDRRHLPGRPRPARTATTT